MSINTVSVGHPAGNTLFDRALSSHSLFSKAAIILMGASICLGLFVFMAQLIDNDQIYIDKPSDPPVIELLQQINEPRPLPPRVKPEPPKPLPKVERIIPTAGEPGEPGITPVDLTPTTVTTETFAREAISAEALPLVQVEPRYPIAAAQNGLEGYVIVGFDITAQGTVTQARVLESNPKRIFDKAALQAVQNWKYKPKLDAGRTVGQRNQSVRLDFTLEKQR
jgi:periplasmic protein TonB